MPSWISCPHVSALNLTPTKKSNSHNTQRVLMSSTWLPCGTGRYCSLPSERQQIVRIISLLVLPHQVQGVCIHDPFNCWVISGFFSAACAIINTPVTMHNQHSSRKANRKVKSRPHRRLSLPPPRHLRHLVLLLLILPCQVQVRSHGSFYHRLVPCFFFTYRYCCYCSMWIPKSSVLCNQSCLFALRMCISGFHTSVATARGVEFDLKRSLGRCSGTKCTGHSIHNLFFVYPSNYVHPLGVDRSLAQLQLRTLPIVFPVRRIQHVMLMSQ
ncbi:hypothetical protein P692DRAFT_20337000 [Suillus brevipes Sb2]|nr:hypothetical protein P692DRAFT_20337000 [Suillus brevipes Sb2]